MWRYIIFSVFMIVLLIIGGCTTSNVVTKSPGKYSVTSSVLVFQTLAGAKEAVYEKAHNYCSKRNKTVKTLDLKTRPVVVGKPGEASLTFTCIKKQSNNTSSQKNANQ